MEAFADELGDGGVRDAVARIPLGGNELKVFCFEGEGGVPR